MIIKDALHQNIYLNEFEKRVVDTPSFQRMRRIKQLGVTYLVYPGATHTRFEHSLGTMHIASEIADHLKLEKEEKEKVRLYGLLHDIGHSAFSHEGEKAVCKFLGDHETLGKKRMHKGKLGDLLREKYSKKEIDSLGDGVEKIVIAGDVGADRMDYLLRDAYHIGVSYGTVDIDRIIHMLSLEKGKLVIEKKGFEAAESLLIGRFMMFSTVYLHKTVRIASAMLNLGILVSLDDGLEPEEIANGTDQIVLEKMLAAKNGRKYATALLERTLYKQAYSIDGALVNPEVVAEELSALSNCEVVVDLPPILTKPLDIRIKSEKRLESMMEKSELVRSLFLAEERRKKTLILCPEKNRKTVMKKAKKYFQ